MVCSKAKMEIGEILGGTNWRIGNVTSLDDNQFHKPNESLGSIRSESTATLILHWPGQVRTGGRAVAASNLGWWTMAVGNGGKKVESAGLVHIRTMMDADRGGGTAAGGGSNSVVDGSGTSIVNMDCQPSSSVIINIPPPSPRSPRLAHLRPPSPLTPEAMRRIHLLTVQEGNMMDASKLSPISPLYATSDLGSSPRSSISVTTSSSSSSAWSAFREHKKSSSDFTDADSDCCKDLFSPSIMLSPAPFSPFSDHPESASFVETPAYSDPTSTPLGQRLRFTFDPKSPSFLPLPPSRSSHFLLPPTPCLGVVRERSRSDSDTTTTALDSSSNDDSSPGGQERATGTINGGGIGASSLSPASASAFTKPAPRRQFESHKHLYKKRLLRKYTEETESVSISLESARVSDNVSSGPPSAASTIVTVSTADDEASAPKNVRSIAEETTPTSRMVIPDSLSSVTSLSISSLASWVSPSAPVSPTVFRPASSLGLSTSSSGGLNSFAALSPTLSKSASASSQPVSSNPSSTAAAAVAAVQRSMESAGLPLVHLGGAGNLSNQSYFDLWFKQQLLAVNTLWYPPPQPPTDRGPPPSVVTSANVSSAVPVLVPPRPFFGGFPTSPNSSSVFSSSSSQHPQPKPSPPIAPMDTTPPSAATEIVAAPRRSLHPSSHAPPPPAPSASAAGSSASTIGPMKSRRSRSESDVSYVCQYCGQSFSLHDRLAKHVASRHRDRSSSSESPLKSHKCGVCHKAFGRSDMLTRHMRLHTGIKPYACRVCGQVFSRSDHLSTHHRTHTGEKPYQCPQCPYAASRRDMITRHMRTHSRSGYPEHSSSSPPSSSSSSSTSGAIAGGGGNPTDDGASSAAIGYVSVIRRALDHSLLLDPRSIGGGGDSEDTGSQLTTPRMSAGSSGRTSTGSVSTILCAEEDEDDMIDEEDDEEATEDAIDEAAKPTVSVHDTSPSVVLINRGSSSSTTSSSSPKSENGGHPTDMIVKIESPDG